MADAERQAARYCAHMVMPKPANTKPALPAAEPTAALQRLLQSLAENNGPDLSAYADAERLSAPERRVLQGLVAGQTPAALAPDLKLAPSTVRRHTAALCRKTGYASLAALLMALGRLPPAPWAGDKR
jgi:FixJ family two-component response regulator